MSVKKKQKTKRKSPAKKLPKKINPFQIISDWLVLLGRPVYLIIESLISLFEKSHEEIIYRSKDFRKKRKLKTFKIKINFFKKFSVKTRIKILIIFLSVITILVITIWYFLFRGLPSHNELITRKINATTSIYDRNGILLYQIYKDQNRTPVALSQIPQSVKDATLASEDVNFYSEGGFSLKGIIRALLSNIANKELS